MINQQKFCKDMDRATAMMRSGDIEGAGVVFQSLYAMLQMDSYKQRFILGNFDRVFFGLSPNHVLSLLLNMSVLNLNACRAKSTLDIIGQYNRIEEDFSIYGPLDFIVDKNEIEAYRRLGDNRRALQLCDRLLEKDISHTQKVDILIIKGTIERIKSHQVFGINSLSLALAEAEAEGSPSLIAKCYLELAAMVGIHYPALGLSFLWKARVHYEKANEQENVSFCKSRMAMTYFLLWHKSQQKADRFINEARHLVNEGIKREDFRQAGAQYSFDRLKGVVNNNLELIKISADFFESINAYEEVCRSAEFYIKVALTIGDRAAAKQGAKLYEKSAMALNDNLRVDYIQSLDLDNAIAVWTPEQSSKDFLNLLDVLEMIAYDEEYYHLEKNTMRLMFPTHYQEGLFETVLMPDGNTHLYPCSLYPFRYYRGQSDRLDGKKCQPSLFRNLSDTEMFRERLCLKELELLLKEYPLTKIYKEGLFYKTPQGVLPISLNVDTTALGQHYGIKTDVLDLTSDKWVAAFFASTKFENGEYQPYSDYGVGVMYVYTDCPIFNSGYNNRLSAVGLQPFSRPGCQAGLVYKMKEDEDFNNMAERIIFKHDPAISELIFNYCNRSKKLFPDEILEEKVKGIKSSREFSRSAFNNTIEEYYKKCNEETIQMYVKELEITFQDEIPVRFTEEELKTFDDKWEKEKDHFFDSVYVR